MNVPAKAAAPAGDVMESVIAKGDLAKLTPDERVQYYQAVCKSLGLNPLTQPLSYMTLSGKLTLYATRTCTDQLRKINNVSVEVVSRHIADDILTVQVKATTPDGRSDEDFGSVAFPSALKGEARANAVMKAVTKAKRRATLSICGLGWLDETEVEAIPGTKLPPHNPQTGEIIQSDGAELAPPSDAADAAPSSELSPREVGAALLIEALAKEAAMRGEAVFREFYRNRTEAEKARINAMGDELRGIMDGDLPDDHTEHMKRIEAFKRGQAARSAGHKRQALPPEYREDDRAREGLCWTAGFDGSAMPEFGD
jgi:hypothetical protein